MKKILILCGHPDDDSMNYRFVEAYAKGASQAGHEVRKTNLADMRFDPILHHGYRVIQELEPDLIKLQQDIKWSDHFVIIYPSWWSTMPALLKGVFDRIWLPGFAFHLNKHYGDFGWKRLLKGRTARVFVTSDSHPFMSRLVFGDTTNEIKRGILWFAGFSVGVKKVGPMKHLTDEQKEKWLKQFEKWGEKVY